MAFKLSRITVLKVIRMSKCSFNWADVRYILFKDFYRLVHKLFFDHLLSYIRLKERALKSSFLSLMELVLNAVF